MSYYFQAGIDRSERFMSEADAYKHFDEFLQVARINVVRLKKNRGELVAVYVHNIDLANRKIREAYQQGWNTPKCY